MKAAFHTRYGSSNAVQLTDLAQPVPAEDELLVRVAAVSINDFDWGLISGKPWFIRLFLGIRKPKIQISGCDIAGEVVSIGSRVSGFQVGDQVFGDLSGGRFGGFAEYVACKEEQVFRKPAGLSFQDAAGIPQAAVLAWQALTSAGQLQAGWQVLINGAGGGVGTYGAQLAKRYGVVMTGVDSADKLETMRSVGFDYVVDYRSEDFTRSGKRYDLIVDTKTNRWPSAYLRALKPGGTYATVGGSAPRYLAAMLLSPIYSRLTGKKLKLITLEPNFELEFLGRLAEKGELKTVVDGPYPFTDFHRAFDHFLSARHQGKVIITMPGH